MTVITKELPKSVLADRRARDEDWRVRFSLGLRYVVFRYGPYNSTPLELYQDKEGRKFVKVELGLYKEIT